MVIKPEQLNADRLVDPSRRELLLTNASPLGLAGFLGGGIWSIPTEVPADSASNRNVGDKRRVSSPY